MKQLTFLSLIILFIFINSAKIYSQANKEVLTKSDLIGKWKLISEDLCDECEPIAFKEDKFLIFYSNDTCEGVLNTADKFQKGTWKLEGRLLIINLFGEGVLINQREYSAQFYDNKLYLIYQAYFGSANRIFVLKND